MSEQQITTIEPKVKWSKQKIGLLVLAAAFLIGTIFYQVAADKVKSAAEQSLLLRANEAVNGQILVGGINLSVLGYVEVKEVQVLDTAGKPLAKINRIHISYNWSDLLKGQLGPQMIKAVTVDKPEFWIAYQQNRSDWNDLLKTKTDEQANFSGLVKIQDGKLHLKTDFFEKTVDQLTGGIDFQENQIYLSATGKVDQAPFRLEGQWGTLGIAEITLSAEQMDLAKFGLTAADDPIQLTGGILDELTVKIGKDTASDAILLKTFSGRFSGVKTAGALELTQGSAQFTKQDNAIQFINGQALYQGQNVTAAGQVLTSPSGEKTLDFDIQMPAGDPAVLLSSLQAGGTLTAQGKVTGSVFSPVLSGNFTLGSLQFGNMIISGIDGTFSYTKQTLKLLNAKGVTLGGSVAANGEIYPDTQQYTLAISGSGLDTSQLTEKDVKGPLSLAGTATGSAAAATLQGSFTIYNGSAYGVSFRTLTGNFVKRGSAEAEVSNLAIVTDWGTFYPEQLNQAMTEKLRERNLPTTGAEIKEKVTEKLLEKLFR
ncbi:hypothetical protein [Sporomusa aerivorans]|uniref:hypothetical protein n=1 Tax=Sporomusa aerivorans TaxID=204936 RepID=UPI00352A36D6